MKKNIFLYLFVFSLLINILQYVNSSKILTTKDHEISAVKSKLKQSRDSISEMYYNDYFDISKDEEAQDYFYNQGFDYKHVMAKVNEDLNILNTNKAGNPLVPYEAINDKVFIVNKAKIINHRWLIAEYSNGELWGQILVKYFHNETEPTEFETIDTVLYTAQNNP